MNTPCLGQMETFQIQWITIKIFASTNLGFWVPKKFAGIFPIQAGKKAFGFVAGALIWKPFSHGVEAS
jgi:hypothetical protein